MTQDAPPVSASGSAALAEPSIARHNVPLHLLRLAIPIIASTISRTIMSFVDFVMVSQISTEAQAAIMPAGIFIFCLIAFGMGSMTAVSTYVSQSLGRNRPADCAAYTWQGLYLSLLMGLAVLPLWWAMPPFWAWVGHDPQVQAMETDYAQISLLGVGFMIGAVVLSNFFNGIHRPGLATASVIGSNLLNFVLNYALIYGHFGAPAMGIAGAAWGTAIAGAAQTLFLMACFLWPHYRQAFDTWRTWRWQGAYARRLLGVGVPMGIQFVADVVAWAVFTIFLVGRFGTEQLAANNIAFKYLELAFMPAFGLGMALTAAVGKSIGEGRHDLARQYVRWALGFNMGYMGLIGGAMALFGPTLTGWFTDDLEVILWGGRIMVLCAIFQIFDAMQITVGSALRGAGDTRWPALAQITLAAIVFLGGGYFVAQTMPEWGSIGPWVTATLYIICIGSVLALRFRMGPWEQIDLHGDQAQALCGELQSSGQ